MSDSYSFFTISVNSRVIYHTGRNHYQVMREFGMSLPITVVTLKPFFYTFWRQEWITTDNIVSVFNIFIIILLFWKSSIFYWLRRTYIYQVGSTKGTLEVLTPIFFSCTLVTLTQWNFAYVLRIVTLVSSEFNEFYMCLVCVMRNYKETLPCDCEVQSVVHFFRYRK